MSFFSLIENEIKEENIEIKSIERSEKDETIEMNLKKEQMVLTVSIYHREQMTSFHLEAVKNQREKIIKELKLSNLNIIVEILKKIEAVLEKETSNNIYSNIKHYITMLEEIEFSEKEHQHPRKYFKKLTHTVPLIFGFLIVFSSFAWLHTEPIYLFAFIGLSFVIMVLTLNIKMMKQIVIEMIQKVDYDDVLLIQTIKDFCEWSKSARRKGIIYLDNLIPSVNERILKNGLEDIITNIDSKTIKENIEISVNRKKYENRQLEHAIKTSIYSVLTSSVLLEIVYFLLNNQFTLVFTCMGISISAFILVPLYKSFKRIHKKELIYLNIIEKGLISIYEQTSPIIIGNQLRNYLNRKEIEKYYR